MKYNSKKIHTPDGDFDSKTEYYRYLELKQMLGVGKISNLRRQVTFEIIPAIKRQVEVQLKTKVKIKEVTDEKATHYTPDFVYMENGVMVIEEVKSSGTRMARDYSLRRKLMKLKVQENNKENKLQWLYREVIYGEKKKR